MSKQAVPFALLFVCLFLYAGCNSSSTEQNSVTKKQDLSCPFHLLFEKSWVFNPKVQQYLGSDSYHDDSYGFVDRGLRTTSYAHMGTTVDAFFSRSTSEASAKLIPEKAKRILIVGPGLDFSHPELGEEVPQQSYEPFAILDILLKSRRSDFEDIKIDLFDISSRVVEHWEDLLKSANQGKPY